jgi:2-haloalkanoic acid dehalogenase type II
MIKAIIFDCWDTSFGNVINKPHPFSIFAEKIGKNFHDYDFLKTFEKHFMLEKHTKLETPIKDLLKELNVKFSGKLLNELKNILENALKFQKAYPETLDVLHKLKKNYKLAMISNTFYQSFKGLEKKFKLNEIFDVILKSYETKILKPDSRLFERAIKKLKVNKNEIIAVGDSLEDDMKPAKRFGIKCVLIDRTNKHPDYPDRITSLRQLERFL